jgi:N-acetyl-anhydromuramyl-L-alanine amidase AmpD
VPEWLAVVGSRLAIPLVVVLALATTGARADASARPKAPQTTWDPAPLTNYQPAHRKPGDGDIHYIVIHVTDGSYAGAVAWLTNAQAHVSSHYVISREGEITQLVARRDIAWHSGNHMMNAESIGIEHEGMTDDPSGFTDAEYRASAHLVAWLVHVYGIPIDRTHIIGHSDVPDPTDPTQGGGIDHHTDPGQYWDWTTYLRLVRKFARGPVVPAPRLMPIGIVRGRPIAGIVNVHTRVAHVRRVDFLLDGRLLVRDKSAPFGMHWNTNSVRNGRHTLVLRAYGRRGKTVVSRIPIVVANHALRVGIDGVGDHAFVDRLIRFRASIHNGPARSVTFLLDGHVVARRSRAPFAFRWNGAKAAEGFHVLELRARAVDGRRAWRKVTVMVAHAKAAIVGESLAPGQTVQGQLEWSVTVQGSVRRVEWLIDGKLRWTSTSLPFVFGGKGALWDTTRETPGSHQLTVRAVNPDGSVSELTIPVTVVAP